MRHSFSQAVILRGLFFQQIRYFPRQIIAYGFLEIIQCRFCVDWSRLIPVCAVIGINFTFVVFLFGKNIQLRFAEAHQIHYLGISLLCVIGIPQVTACLFAICSRIPVNGKVDELYSVVFLVRFTDSENIYIGLDT